MNRFWDTCRGGAVLALERFVAYTGSMDAEPIWFRGVMREKR